MINAGFLFCISILLLTTLAILPYNLAIAKLFIKKICDEE
jgi:hypothetical protein